MLKNKIMIVLFAVCFLPIAVSTAPQQEITDINALWVGPGHYQLLGSDASFDLPEGMIAVIGDHAKLFCMDVPNANFPGFLAKLGLNVAQADVEAVLLGGISLNELYQYGLEECIDKQVTNVAVITKLSHKEGLNRDLIHIVDILESNTIVDTPALPDNVDASVCMTQKTIIQRDRNYITADEAFFVNFSSIMEGELGLNVIWFDSLPQNNSQLNRIVNSVTFQ